MLRRWRLALLVLYERRRDISDGATQHPMSGRLVSAGDQLDSVSQVLTTARFLYSL